MVKHYQDYCREAVAREPKLYSDSIKEDGSRKPAPNMSKLYRDKKTKARVPIIIRKKFSN